MLVKEAIVFTWVAGIAISAIIASACIRCRVKVSPMKLAGISILISSLILFLAFAFLFGISGSILQFEPMRVGFAPVIVAAFLIAFFMAWNIGANDTANSVATSIGSGVLGLRGALLRIIIFDFAGAVLFGVYVTKTIGKGIVDISAVQDTSIVIAGALSALLAASMWIMIATWKALPVSTTHSIVGGMLGFGLIATGAGAEINWGVMGKIALSWITSPVFGAFAAFSIFLLLRKFLIERVEDVGTVERTFGYLQVATAMYVGFSFGANDVANAVGPLYLILSSHQGSIIVHPIAVLAFGGAGIVIGALTWGYRVISTIGEKITALHPTRGFAAEFSTASVVLAASYLGMPISTTHTIVGSVIGVGLAGGLEAVNLRVVRSIIIAWLFTVPTAMLFSTIIYMGVHLIV